MVSTCSPSTDTLLQIPALEGHFEITVSPNMHTVNLKSYVETIIVSGHYPPVFI
jgi:hypothetical protein